MKNVSIYIYTEYSGSIAKGSGIYNIIWECIIPTDKGDYPATMEEIKSFDEITRNQLALKALESSLQHMREPAQIKVFIDSDYIVSAYEQGWIYKWMDNNFKSKGRPIKNADTWSHVVGLSEWHDIEIVKAEKTSYSKAQAIEVKLFREKL